MGKPDPLCLLNLCGSVGVELGYCVLSRSSNQPFPQFYLADSSGGDQGGQQLFAKFLVQVGKVIL